MDTAVGTGDARWPPPLDLPCCLRDEAASYLTSEQFAPIRIGDA